MSEPMTDADLAVIERQIAGWNALRPGSRSPMLWSNAAVGPLLARIRASEAERDAERSRADAAEAARDAALAELAEAEAEADRWFKRAMAAIGKLPTDMRCGDLQDAHAEIENRMTYLVRERDAALARAMPEPKLVRTVEEVEALAAGLYVIRWADRWASPSVAEKGDDGKWWEPGLTATGPAEMVGAWISGPLPSLPIPPTED